MTVIELGGRPRRELADDLRRLSRKNLLYEEVIDVIEQLISEQDLQPGDLLPSQAEIGKLANVSMITVRRALDDLERSGRVRRRQGLGTFVAKPRIVISPARPGGLLGTMNLDGPQLDLDNIVVEFKRRAPSAEVAAALQISPNDEVWVIGRQRLLKDSPLLFETAVIPASLAPELDRFTATLRGSLYEVLAKHFGLVDDYEEQVLAVVTPSPAERSNLKLVGKEQVVRLRGRTFDANGVIFDCFEQVYHAEDFVFSISGAVSKQLIHGLGSAVRISDLSDQLIGDGAPLGES